MTYCSLLILGPVWFSFYSLWVVNLCIMTLHHYTAQKKVCWHQWPSRGQVLLLLVRKIFLCYGTLLLISSPACLWSAPRISTWSPTILNLAHIIHQHNVNFHCLADDTPSHVPLSGSKAESGTCEISHVVACLSDIRCGMPPAVLQLNDSKSGSAQPDQQS